VDCLCKGELWQQVTAHSKPGMNGTASVPAAHPILRQLWEWTRGLWEATTYNTAHLAFVLFPIIRLFVLIFIDLLHTYVSTSGFFTFILNI